MNNPEWPDELWQRCLKLKRQGLGNREIAKQLGVTRESVMGKLWRKGISAKPGVALLDKPPAARDRRIRVRPGQRTLPPLASVAADADT